MIILIILIFVLPILLQISYAWLGVYDLYCEKRTAEIHLSEKMWESEKQRQAAENSKCLYSIVRIAEPFMRTLSLLDHEKSEKED